MYYEKILKIFIINLWNKNNAQERWQISLISVRITKRSNSKNHPSIQCLYTSISKSTIINEAEIAAICYLDIHAVASEYCRHN